MDHYIIPSLLGKMRMTLENDILIGLDFATSNASLKLPKNEVGQHIASELSLYLENPRHHFSVNLLCRGTLFQQKVWKNLQRIPCGQVMTYGMLAKQLNTHPRAIGQACRTNPITIIIPCHRVIAAHHLGGYAGERSGALWEIKQWLLKHEEARNQIDEIYNQSGRSMFVRCGNSRR